ncbi:MAG: glycosyltransferase family 4 protein [Thermoleophilia bacterium]|nr:glycosyltransferase family 4 protein [Thermoleophilia bacterium]
MKIVLWHGYLLSATGSNIYTQAVAREWGRAGHEVVVVCQEREPEALDLAGARVVRPDVGPVLPVFVLDRYEGFEVKLAQDLTPAERRRYVEANAAAIRAQLPADVVFANHVVMGAPVARAAGAPFAVKVHGSELEYAMRLSPDLCEWGGAALREAEAVFVGSDHIGRVLAELVGPVGRVHVVPPGVDVDEFRPRPHDEALRDLLAECRRDPPNPGNANERLPDEGNAERLEHFFAEPGPVVLYFGKLLYNKGVHVLLEALRGIEARALVVGFGDYRAELEAIAPPTALFTGPLKHRHLVHLIPLVDAAAVPSIFPEAFGMVAAEAAACGCPPLVARHSGLAEVAAGLERAYPARHRELVAFETGDSLDLGFRLARLLALPAEERAALGAAARRAVVENWAWASVARRLLEPFELRPRAPGAAV